MNFLTKKPFGSVGYYLVVAMAETVCIWTVEN